MVLENIKIESKFILFRFNDLTGNFWKYRDQFIKVPGHYYLLSNDLNSSVRKEVYLIFVTSEELFYFTLD
jgi:hypothetical protein